MIKSVFELFMLRLYQILKKCVILLSYCDCGPIVYRLGRKLLKLQSGVRLPVGSQFRTFPNARRSATNSDGTGAPKHADLSRTVGFVPTFLTKELISWKSADELKNWLVLYLKSIPAGVRPNSFPRVQNLSAFPSKQVIPASACPSWRGKYPLEYHHQ